MGVVWTCVSLMWMVEPCVWFDCSGFAAWKTAKIALPCKVRGWVVSALNVVLTCVVLVLSFEPGV